MSKFMNIVFVSELELMLRIEASYICTRIDRSFKPFYVIFFETRPSDVLNFKLELQKGLVLLATFYILEQTI